VRQNLQTTSSKINQAEPEQLSALFGAVGKLIKVEGNEPFWLNDPGSVWWIQQGRVELFSILTETKIRHHLFTVPAGGIVFGLETDDKLRLLAVGGVNTQIIKLPLSRFKEFAAQEGYTKVLGQLVTNWVADLAQNLTQEMLTVPTQVALEENQAVELAARQKVGLARGGVWLRLKSEAHPFFLAEEEIKTPVFPLFGNTWLETVSTTQIQTYATENLIAQSEFWQGLSAFQKMFLNLKTINIRFATYDEIERLHRKAAYDNNAGKKAIQHLNSVLSKSAPPSETPNATDNESLLLKACQLVGKAQDIPVQTPLAFEQTNQRRNLLHEIARASRFRTRQITLSGNWWQYDNGPLLGFRQTPVALLPTSEKSYVLVDPLNNDPIPLNATTAKDLASFAFVFYRPLPARALKIGGLLKFGLRGTYRDLFTMLFLSGLGGLLGLGVPLLTGQVIDSVIPLAHHDALWQIMLLLGIIAISSATFQLARSVAVLRLQTRLETSVQSALLDRLLGLEITFFRRFSVGDLAERVLGISVIRQVVGNSLLTAILGAITGLFSGILLFTFDWRLALVALGLSLLTVIITLGIGVAQLPYQRKLTEKQGQNVALVLQFLNGIAKLRIAGAEIRAFERWAREFANQRKLSFQVRKIGNLIIIFNAVWPILTLLVLYGGFDAWRTNLSAGSFLAFNAAFSQFLTALLSLATAFLGSLQVIPLYERTKAILNTLPEVAADKRHPGELSGQIELNKVSFQYSPETPLVLKNITISIQPGQFVAIVGPSGSGKSSLIRLLLGFEKPTGGAIYYDNQDFSCLDLQEVRRQIGVVTQNSRLIPGDIFHNIIGSLPLSHEEAWEAARQAGIAQDILEMPMNMFTFVGEGGTVLSGGQRQRLLLARAIVTKPRILFLDEATSALDNQMQALVIKSLENLQATRVVIAHRLSTIQNADYIYVLNEGQIVQEGTYDRLVAQEGTFKQMVSRQV
jgi:NHLM bacteriocin system ABC transporter ATP-binding protein